MMGRLVILSALSLNAFPMETFTLRIKRVNFEELPMLARTHSPIFHFIRHQATVPLLSKYLPLNLNTNPGLYRYEAGDVLLIVTLKNPQRGQELSAITENDVELFLVNIE